MLIKIAACVAFGMVLSFSVWLLQQNWQRVREMTWNKSTSTIEQVRPVVAAKVDSEYRGTMLYDVQVLVRYNPGGASAERWVTVRQTPKPLPDIELEALRWKGQKCTVLWNPSNADQVDIEINSQV